MVGFVEICQKLFRRIMFRAARSRAVQLPEILEAGRFMNGLPVLGRAAFSLTIIHQRDPRMNSVHQLRRPRMRIAVARGVKHGESADQIIGTRQRVLLIPRQVAKIEEPKAAVSDDESNRFKIFGRGILIF